MSYNIVDWADYLDRLKVGEEVGDASNADTGFPSTRTH